MAHGLAIGSLSFDHGSGSGLGDDDHTQYALLAGRSGGQSLIGGTASGNDLTLQSTSHGTKGSIFFGSSTGAEYDETNQRFGVNTSSTSPAGSFHAIGNTPFLVGDRFSNDVGSATCFLRKARGTTSTSAATQSGDQLGTFSFAGEDDTTPHTWAGVSARLVAFATENFTASARGSNLTFETTPNGSTTRVVACEVSEASNLILGGAADPSTGDHTLVLANGTAPTTMAANAAGLYAADVSSVSEVFAIDEGGSATQLSPHNFELFTPDPTEPYPWSYYSYQPYLGLEIGVDLAKLCRLVEGLTGETLIHSRPAPQRDWAQDQQDRMEAQMKRYEWWEAQQEMGEDVAPPALPAIKDPPTWLRTRLPASSTQALRAQLAQWQQQKAGRRDPIPSPPTPR